jgi:hypothetical protein
LSDQGAVAGLLVVAVDSVATDNRPRATGSSK